MNSSVVEIQLSRNQWGRGGEELVQREGGLGGACTEGGGVGGCLWLGLVQGMFVSTTLASSRGARW